MKTLWIAYLFSQLGKAELQEFFLVSALIERGLHWQSPDIAEQSNDWRRLQLLCPALLAESVFIKFEHEITRAEKLGIVFTYPGCSDYPSRLLCLNEIPFFLSYIGTPVWLEKEALAIVGSREPSEISENWCESELPKTLRELPIFSVSGGARGVDQIAHRISVRLQKPTVALVPSGLLDIYPETLQALATSIRENKGALVSEFMPRVRMQKSFFQRRNRLIAGFSLGCLIIEARKNSGTMITAKQVIEQSKPLFVLPSHPLDSGARGGLDLLSEGATPVRDAQDLTMFIRSELKGNYWSKSDIVFNPGGIH
jgi:DNA processing protein